MSDFFFISYSSADGKDFARKLDLELAAGPPPITVWLDERKLRPGEDWDEQLAEAISTCKGMIFVMSADSVRPDSVCKNEWVKALKYKKPVIPLLLNPDADMPLLLGSRQHIDFSGSFESPLAQLRKHLLWLDSPEGQLQALKYRLSDAERALPRTQPERQARIREDIEDLKRQIVQQQKVVDDPDAVNHQVKKRVDSALESERHPLKPVSGITTSKFINPPPMIPPSYFQNRHFESGQIGAFLKDESLRLTTIVGRGGVGKTAMVCRVLRSLEGGKLPDDGGTLPVDGIVYLSAARSFHRTNLPDLFSSLCKLLPDDMVKQLDTIYKNPQSTTRANMEALLQAFPGGRTVVLLDNFEDMLSVETGAIKDAELDEALRAILELPPHGIKVIITTRVALSDLALVQPGLQRRLDLDKGLGHPDAENILRAMDADGKVGLRNAPDSLLAEAVERTLGYPRALELLFGILSADRDTSLEEILKNTQKLLPEKVTDVLVGEAFSCLDLTAQRVMQAMAAYRYPVLASAVDYLLQPFIPAIDSGRVLSRLVNMQFVRRDAGRYYLHQVDRDFALSRLAQGDPDDRKAEIPPLTQFALRHRAAEWFKLSRKPREAWKTLADVAAQLSEFELRCDGEDYDNAAALLLEFGFRYLLLWGHFGLLTELHERLQGKITNPELAGESVYNLGGAYYRMGQIQRATVCWEQALQMARQANDKTKEGVCLGSLGVCTGDLGQNARAIEYHEQALAISREVSDRSGEAADLLNLAILYKETGQYGKATEYCQQVLVIYREIEARHNEAEALDALGGCYRDVGRPDEALKCHSEALAIAQRIGYRPLVASAHNNVGCLLRDQGRWSEAEREFEQAIEIGDEIGSSQISKEARQNLALVHAYGGNLAEARNVAEATKQYDVSLSNHTALAILGLVAVRQGDVKASKLAFRAAIDAADRLIALTPDRWAALDAKGLSCCGLALCGDAAQIPAAKAAYSAARTVTSVPGVVREVLQQFDALANVDAHGILAEVRPLAAALSRDVSVGSQGNANVNQARTFRQ